LIALIPARLGSKRFPGKNRAKLGGKSLLERAHSSAISSGVIEEVFISTDDDFLMRQSEDLGITVPFKRAPELARDETSSWEVVRDFISQTGYDGEVCLLQLTSPFREAIDIQNLYSIYKSNEVNSGLTVRTSDVVGSTQEGWLCDCSGIISGTWHCGDSKPILPNGSVYIVNSSSLSLSPFTPLTGCAALLMPSDRSLDLDYEYQLDNLGGIS
jgi:CMP-N-acetylneuraminic acid synthetase